MSIKDKKESEKKESKLKKVIDFLKKNENKIVLGLGIFLLAVISFEAGVLQGHKLKASPLLIEMVPEKELVAANNVIEDKGTKQVKSAETQASESTECAFVGSKNSNKYHRTDCQWAKRIKPENIICFKGEEEAKSRGYIGDKGCIK